MSPLRRQAKLCEEGPMKLKSVGKSLVLVPTDMSLRRPHEHHVQRTGVGGCNLHQLRPQQTPNTSINADFAKTPHE